MKIKKEVFTKKLTFKYLLIIVAFLVVGIIAQLKPTKVSDVTVQLSLLAMEKGYQGVTRINSGERSYTSTDYLKKLILSPTNLMNAEFTPLKKILIDMPFESESLLEQEINSALSFGRSNQRNDIDVNAELVTSVNERIDVEIKTKDMVYTFNLRNKQGGIYPSHLMCDFKHHNDQM